MDRPSQLALVHRETVALCVLAVIGVGAFFATRAVARVNEAGRLRDAHAWLVRGQASLKSQEPAAAVRQLRRAVTLQPQDIAARLALVSALREQGDISEARVVLLRARDVAPANADVNLALARLEARAGELEPTIAAYQSALASLWRPSDAGARFQVRDEFARYLVAHGAADRALPEILMLTTELPDTAPARGEVGHLLLSVGETARALTELERALTLGTTDPAVRLDAGRAAFALGQDRRALHHLAGATGQAEARELAALVTLVAGGDPLAPRLSVTERERRLQAALARADQRLTACASSGTLDAATTSDRQQLTALQARLTTARHRAASVIDLLDEGMALVSRIEGQMTGCAGATTEDEALRVIGQRHEARS